MEDAKRKKRMWKERLRETAVESLWILRETLLIKGAAFMMVLEDNKSNAAESTKLVSTGRVRQRIGRRGRTPLKKNLRFKPRTSKLNFSNNSHLLP